MSRRNFIPNAAVVVGELSALTLLAPMEWATARYIGAPNWAAWTVTGLVYAVAVLAIWVGELVVVALALIWTSGVIGALHAATEAAHRDGQAVDRFRLGTSIAVVTVVVLAMAAIWHLGQRHHAKQATAEAARKAEATAREADRLRRLEAEREAQRAHVLEKQQLAQEAADREAWRRQEEARVAAQREAERIAAEDAARAAEHARALELLRAQNEAQRAPRSTAARAPQTERKLPEKKAAATPQTTPDLQRRAEAKDRAMATLRAGGSVDAREFAVSFYGVDIPTEKELNAARANLSTWKRSIAAEGAQSDGDRAAGAVSL